MSSGEEIGESNAPALLPAAKVSMARSVKERVTRSTLPSPLKSPATKRLRPRVGRSGPGSAKFGAPQETAGVTAACWDEALTQTAASAMAAIVSRCLISNFILFSLLFGSCGGVEGRIIGELSVSRYPLSYRRDTVGEFQVQQFQRLPIRVSRRDY